MDHKQEVLSYFNDKIFEPGIRFSKENNIPEIARGIRYTKMRMEQLPNATKVIQYFWSAVIGTEKSIKFAELLKEHNVLRFEDIIEEVRVKFNHEYLNS